MAKHVRFGKILLDKGIITERELHRALNHQKITGQPLGQIFERLGIICDKDILRILARQYNLKAVERIEKPVQFTALAKIIDGQTALKHRIFPLGVKDGCLYVATCNPLDLATLDGISFRTGFRLKALLATPTEIDGAIRCYYLSNQKCLDEGGKKILVVDDQEIYRESISANLRTAGYHPLVAANGIEAMQIILSHMPHLVLLDIMVPGMNGKEIFRTMQTNRRTCNIPIIALSTCATPENEAALLNMGFFDFVAKPFKFVRLMARVRRALSFCQEGRKEASTQRESNRAFV